MFYPSACISQLQSEVSRNKCCSLVTGFGDVEISHVMELRELGEDRSSIGDKLEEITMKFNV